MKLVKITNNQVENIILVDPENIPDWCVDWPVAPEGVNVGDDYDEFTNKFSAPVKLVTSEQVNRERDRRISGTFTFEGNTFDCDQKSLARITGAATLAGFAIAAGVPAGYLFWHGGTSPFVWITADNSIVSMDAQTVFALGQAAAANETAHIFAARALKDMTPIPVDFASDSYWP